MIRFVSRRAGNRPQRETFLPRAPPGARAAVTGAGCADQWALSLPSRCLVRQRGLGREPLPSTGRSWGCRKGPGHGPDLLAWASSVLPPRGAGARAPARLTVTTPPPRRWSTVGVTRGAQRLLHEAGRGAGPETLSPGELRGGAGTPQVGLGTPHIGVCAGSGKGPTGDRDSWPTLRGGQGPGAEPGAGRWGREMLAVRLVFLCRGRGPDCASS